MTRMRPLLTVLVLGGLALPAARAADPDAPEWKVGDVTRVAAELATVRDAEPDGPLPASHRFVATLTAQGRLHFGTAARYVAGDGDAGSGNLSQSDGAVTSRTLQELTQALLAAARTPGMRTADGLSRMRLLIRADRRRPWIEALWLLEAAAAPDVGIARLQFAVDKAGAAADTAWRLPHDFPLGPGAEGPPRRECSVLIELDEAPGGRPLLRLRPAFDAAGASVRRTLAQLVVEAGTELDLDALAEALHAYRALGSREGGPALLVTTLELTERGARRWTLGRALPVLATLRTLGAQTHLRRAPTALLPTPGAALHEGGRSPFAGPPERVTRRSQRWEKAVDEALCWLAAHQSPTGHWEAAGFGRWCDGEEVDGQQPDGAGSAEHDVGVTGLALLAFLGAGHPPEGEHPYVQTVKRGLLYLKRVQDDEGCFGPRAGQHWIYDHGAAAWAMVEAAGLTGDGRFLASAQRGLDFIAVCRNPYFAYRYGVKPGDNDTSVCGWMLMPLALARTVNADRASRGQEPAFVIDEEAFDGVRAWLDKMTDPDYGRTGYIQRGGSVARPQALIDKFPGDKSEAMTAIGITLRVTMGEDPTRSRVIGRGLQLLDSLPPRWNPSDGSIDMYYWHWGALATWQAGRRPWKRWGDALDQEVVPNQRQDTSTCVYRGSWDPIGPWGQTGGRVYATALLALTLETPTRYARRFGR